MTDRQKQLIVHGLEQQKKHYAREVHRLIVIESRGIEINKIEQQLNHMLVEEFSDLLEDIDCGKVAL